MDFTFTPTDNSATTSVPYYEDARADFAPYYRSQKSVKTAKAEAAEELAKLGGVVVAFREGYFGHKPRRYGYEIEFLTAGTHNFPYAPPNRMIADRLPLTGCDFGCIHWEAADDRPADAEEQASNG